MPHCILEYSANIADEPDFRQLLLEVHDYLESTGLFKKADIKSRVVGHDKFVIGDGAPDRAFVTLNLCVLAGRDDSVKAGLSGSIVKILERYFPKTLAERRCSLTVRITDMHKGSYGKSVSYED